MAWTYFTAPLAAGEELTAEMWYELCEALAERYQATQQSTQVNLTVAAQIRDARIQVRGVPISTSGGAAVLTDWNTSLSGSVGLWADGINSPQPLTTSGGASFTTSTEWTAEGLTEAEWGTLKTAVGAGWNDRRYWNIIRATIQRLSVLRYFFDGTASTQDAKFVDEPGWAAALAAYAVVSPTSGAGSPNIYTSVTNLGPSGRFEISTQRGDFPITIPSVSLLSSSLIWTFFDATVKVGPTESYSLSFAGVTVSDSVVAGTDLKVPIGSSVDIRGSQNLTVELDGYADPSPFEPVAWYDSHGAAMTKPASTTFQYIYAQPTWTKP